MSGMATLDEKLLRDALSLPVEQRTELVDKLLESLYGPIDADIEAAWAEEVEKRLEELDSGVVESVPGEEVFKRIRERYQI
jgi:putative addiction module component (TIGR02574 family)